jgi:hypothetical protein
LLVIFFAVPAHLIFVDSDPPARLALRTSKEKLRTYTLLQNNFILLLDLVLSIPSISCVKLQNLEVSLQSACAEKSSVP